MSVSTIGPERAAQPSDLRIFGPPLALLLIALWIVIYPRPYGLVVGFGVLVPFLSFVLSRINDIRRRFIRGQPSAFNAALVVSSVLLVSAVALRASIEFAIIPVAQFCMTALAMGTALTCVAQLCKSQLEVAMFQFFFFTVYCWSVLALGNTHLDRSPPLYVQGG